MFRNIWKMILLLNWQIWSLFHPIHLPRWTKCNFCAQEFCIKQEYSWSGNLSFSQYLKTQFKKKLTDGKIFTDGKSYKNIFNLRQINNFVLSFNFVHSHQSNYFQSPHSVIIFIILLFKESRMIVRGNIVARFNCVCNVCGKQRVVDFRFYSSSSCSSVSLFIFVLSLHKFLLDWCPLMRIMC